MSRERTEKHSCRPGTTPSGAHWAVSLLKSNARRRGISVNRLIVETLRQQHAGTGQTFDDLDKLAGTWSKTEDAAFAAAVAPFAELDPGLWAAEPEAGYRVKQKTGRKVRK